MLGQASPSRVRRSLPAAWTALWPAPTASILLSFRALASHGVSAVAYPASGGGNSPLTSTVRSAIRLYIREQTFSFRQIRSINTFQLRSLAERTCEKAVTGDDPGLLVGEFDGATQAHGPATTRGLNSDTGMARLG